MKNQLEQSHSKRSRLSWSRKALMSVALAASMLGATTAVGTTSQAQEADAATVVNMWVRVYDCDWFLGIRHSCTYVGWRQTNPPYNPNFGWRYIGNEYI